MTSALCVTMPCPGPEATLHRAPPGLRFLLCFLALDCDCSRGSSIPSQLCAFSPWVCSGGFQAPLSLCPLGFGDRVCCGASAGLQVAPPAGGVSRAPTCSSVGLPFLDFCPEWVSVRQPGDHREAARPLTCASELCSTCTCSGVAGPQSRLDMEIKQPCLKTLSGFSVCTSTAGGSLTCSCLVGSCWGSTGAGAFVPRCCFRL